jgi:hypothetical protein
MALSYLRIDTDCPKPALVADMDQRAHLRGLHPAAQATT